MNADQAAAGETRIQGVAVSQGIAIGPAFVFGSGLQDVRPREIAESEIENEIQKLNDAISKAKVELTLLGEQTQQMLGERSAEIFEVHKLMLDDPEINGESLRRIRTERLNADWVFLQVLEKYEQTFAHFKDEYMRARITDVQDVKRRVIRHLQGSAKSPGDGLPGPAVVFSADLLPSETIHLRREYVLGFATELGSRTSHAAILARSLKVPSVVGLGPVCHRLTTGDPVILDGNSGQLIIHPNPETREKYERSLALYQALSKKLERSSGLPARTKDGKDIELAANIEFFEEVKPALADGAMGIGLYRTEYLFMMRDELPSEEDQYNEYVRILDALHRQPIIFRTFDLGGDKAQRHFHVHHEANPFLGFRGVRLYRANEEVFRRQLRAILRASVRGKVRILIPMISCVSEMRFCRRVFESVKDELRAAAIPFDEEIPFGAMIEVPSAAVSADLIARECDFLSIGTNDLVQYTLAVDRSNRYVDSMYRAFSPSVLRLIRDTIRHGHEEGVWVGMCGEMASDPLATMALLGLGLDEFSVSPVSLLVVKEIIRRVHFDECENLADRMLSYDTADEVEQYLRSVFRRKFRDLIIAGPSHALIRSERG
ncbi:MAG TPA: phosphoenolpyruvate--protein phosphotransferase [bacterium]|nr:phosphoenolpyruvate--protein phosphotransferase [bacterium]HQG46417.1 phosphoenolpyruvate--protein phosphotransferase [bacterium]HQI47384.1 phosphoenolpyruvate--protein phosphotransferase [bacterium]HQJ63014.1 phosphoenolpyruvate--protein phosphotransferase [bacterium]